METDAIIGCIVTAAALCSIIGITLWSRKTINWIARSDAESAREIINQRHEQS